MKKQFSIALLLGSMFSFSQIGLGTTTPNLSAQLDVTSTTKGFLMPRMTNLEKTAITLPALGLQIWCTDCGTPPGQLQVYNGTWISYPSATGVLPICGAKTTAGTFLVFMCHNLGVDTSLDPFTYQNPAINGDYYQWGRRKDGHQLVNSTTIETQATNNTATLPTTVIGKFITTNGTSPNDWISPQNNSLWLDASKTANDPCPVGFKVPSQSQWGSIFRDGAISDAPGSAIVNEWKWTGNGYTVGANLYLPAAGLRNVLGAGLSNVGTIGYYWSSTVNGTNAYGLDFTSINVNLAYNHYRGYGFSVRCVSE